MPEVLRIAPRLDRPALRDPGRPRRRGHGRGDAGRLPPLEPDDHRLAAHHRRRALARRPAGPVRHVPVERAPSGSSARPTTCSASSSRATATCAASSCRPTTRASRSARTSSCPTTRPARPARGVRHVGASPRPGRAADDPDGRHPPGAGELRIAMPTRQPAPTPRRPRRRPAPTVGPRPAAERARQPVRVGGRPADHARPPDRRRPLRADPALPDADRARRRVLHPRRRRDVPQHRPAPPGHARRPAPRPEALRRADRGRGPGPRLPPPRRREDLRELGLLPRHRPGRPARIRQLALPGVGRGPGLREAHGRGGAAPRRVHPRPLRRAAAHLRATPSSWASWPWTWAA